MRRGKRPPLRHCRECSGALRAWTEHPLCKDCVRRVYVGAPVESFRDFRKRVIEGKR